MRLPADLTGREIVTLLPLAVGCVVFGLFPALLTDPIEAPVAQTVKLVAPAGPGPLPRAGVPGTEIMP